MVGHAVEDTDALEVGVLGWVVGAAVCDTVGVRLPLPLTVAVSKELWETL